MAGAPVHDQPWRLTPWVEGRIEALAARLSPREVAVALAGLQDCMAYASAIATDMLLQSMETSDEHGRRPEHEETYDEELEEVPVEEDQEDTALVQRPGRLRNNEAEPADRHGGASRESEELEAEHREGRHEAEDIYSRTPPEFHESRQELRSPQAALLLLAHLRVRPPGICPADEETNEGDPESDAEYVTISYLRLAIAKWYRSLPKAWRRRAVQTLFRIAAGVTGDQLSRAQAAARVLQAEYHAVEDPLISEVLTAARPAITYELVGDEASSYFL